MADGYMLSEDAARQLQAMFAAFRAEIEPYILERLELAGRQSVNWKIGFTKTAVALDRMCVVQIATISEPEMPGENIRYAYTGEEVDVMNCFGNVPANTLVGITRKNYGWVITSARCS